VSAVAHQASCVAIGGRAVVIEGRPGSGKSTLALMLIDRGAALVGDDGVLLEAREGRLWALPPPNISGLIEVRNVGLLTLPAEAAPVALIVRLDSSAPRMPESAEQIALAGVVVPLIRLWPGTPALAMRAERALALHGTG
jgi:serine kinase of HPr protein (carbohydrate metabolism regulator)